MDSETSNHENNQSENFSSSSDEIFLTNHQIRSTEKKFDDIDEFWAASNTTPNHTAPIGIPKNSPYISPRLKSPISKLLSFDPTPPRSFQKSISNWNNSPIYVGTSTEETPYRSNSKESDISSEEFQNEDSSSSSDDITFVDTPITDRIKQQSSAFNNPKDVFKLSPITSNKSELVKDVERNENSSSDVSSSEDDISIIKNNYLKEGKLAIEQNKTIIKLNEEHEIFNESSNDSNLPLPTFSISNSSDSESIKDQENSEEINHDMQEEIIYEQNINTNSNRDRNESYRKKRYVSKPAFASPKRSSNGLKEETIITELSPFASSRRKKIESKKLPNFRLSNIDQEEEEMREEYKQPKAIFGIENDNQKPSFYNNNDDINKPTRKMYSSSQNSPIINRNRYKKSFSDDDDSDDIKKIEKLAKNDPLHTKKMDDLMVDYELSKKKSANPDENNEEVVRSAKRKQSKSLSSKNLTKTNDETELNPKNESESPKSKVKSSPKPQNHKKSKSDPKSKVKSKTKFDEVDDESVSKLQIQSKSKSKSKSPAKSKTTKQSNSQPVKTKSKDKKKAEPKSKSPAKSNSQSSKPSPKKSSKKRYDFSNLISDSDDDERISNLIQFPVQTNEKSNNKDSATNINNDDLPIALRRRKRVIVKPLKFWCGEHIVYGLSEDGFQTFQNVSIPEKLRKLKKGENRVMPKDQKRIPAKDDCDRKLILVEGGGLVVFQKKVVDFDKSNEVVLKKGVKCSVACKGELPLIFKIEDI